MVVIVCTITDPLSCVEVDSLVITVGEGVVNWEVGGIVIIIGSVDMVVHEEPNNVANTLLVIGTVKVRGTCTVAVTARRVRVEHYERYECSYLV